MPVQAVQADGAQHFEPSKSSRIYQQCQSIFILLFLVAPAIHQSLSEKPQAEGHGQQGDMGPLSKIIGMNHAKQNQRAARAPR